MTDSRPDRYHAQRAAKLIAATKGQTQSTLGGIWHWINSVASGVGHFFTHTIPAFFRANLTFDEQVIHALHDVVNAYGQMWAWIERTVLDPIVDMLQRQINAVRARERRDIRMVVGLIYLTSNYLVARMSRLVRAERKARQREVAHAEAQARLEIKALHQVLEREAASGYRLDTDQRASIIVRLLDFAVQREPALARIVGDITSGLLDLLSVDDPLARLVLGFLIKHVIDRLGIDKAAGVLAGDLLAPILGQPKPRDIHDVVADLSARLVTVEQQWAQFMVDGGSQVEEAGTEWRNLTSFVTSAAIVGFTAQAAIDPDGWARELSDTIGAAGNDIARAAAALLRG